ncbi:hypothetical protein C8R44DRAFT_40004 [Mycena epipterygia]|nr:hypothetical protein C8R44DRAFT_40004 [Mycena epipterygia]
MGLSSSKPRARPYPLSQPVPLVTPGYNVPYGQNPNLYLPPQLQTQQNGLSNKKKRKSKRSRSGSDQEQLAQAYVQGWHAGHTGMGPQLPHQPAVQQSQQPENIRPVIPPAPVRSTPLFTSPREGAQLTSFASPQVAPTTATQRAQTPFTGSTFAATTSAVSGEGQPRHCPGPATPTHAQPCCIWATTSPTAPPAAFKSSSHPSPRLV